MSRNGGNCALCGSPLQTQLQPFSSTGSDERFSVDRCAVCGLGHTRPQPTDLGRYYDRAYYGNRHGFTDRLCLWRRERFVGAVMGSDSPGALLDVGCGDGSFLRHMAGRGWRVGGVEISESAHDRGFPVWTSVAEAARHGPFHCITAWHSLEHFRDPVDLAGQLAGLLAPGGRLLVAVPDAGGTQARLFARHWLHRDVPRHLFHFEKESLDRLLSAHGLQIMRHWHLELEYDLMGYVQSALNACGGPPNLFFNMLTGKPVAGGRLLRGLHFLAGCILTALAAPLVAVDTLRGRGGTLIVAARRP